MMNREICVGCVDWGVYCDACDDTDKEYIREILEDRLKRYVDISEVCDLCPKYEAYKEVICRRCRL